MRCNDYFEFADTAIPFLNYYVAKNETVALGFYQNNIFDKTSNTKQLNDTVINCRELKRFKNN